VRLVDGKLGLVSAHADDQPTDPSGQVTSASGKQKQMSGFSPPSADRNTDLLQLTEQMIWGVVTNVIHPLPTA
jgi:hypothetical protein